MDFILAQELEPLKAQINQVQEKVGSLRGDLRLVEAELETFSAEQQRFDALRDVCSAFDKLSELEAEDLFWKDLPGGSDNVGHIEQLRERIAGFEDEIRDFHDKSDSLNLKIEQQLGELGLLEGEVYDAYAREERRKEEYLVEREISPIPYRRIVMPWSKQGESEKRFRKALLIALLLCLFFGFVIPSINVPLPDRTAPMVIPERLAMLVKKEPPLPEPIPEPPKKEEKDEVNEEKPKEQQTKDQQPKEQMAEKKHSEPVPSNGDSKKAARKKAESVGVLAFKSSFEDLMEEVPVASLGVEGRIRKGATMAKGQARARRSLVAMQAKGGSGGIGNTGVSRNVGIAGGGGSNGEGIGGVGFARVESAVTDLVAEEGRPVSDGPGPARTDEEIQIVFDRYKATLYRIYNKQLRKDPTLRGKMLLRLTIKPNGEVSLCKLESTDMDSPELVKLILARIEKFNFGPKEGVPSTTILYPIDFLPAG